MWFAQAARGILPHRAVVFAPAIITNGVSLSSRSLHRTIAPAVRQHLPAAAAFCQSSRSFAGRGCTDSSKKFSTAAAPVEAELTDEQVAQLMMAEREFLESVKTSLLELRAQVRDATRELRSETPTSKQVTRRVGAEGYGAQSRKAFRPNFEIAARQPTHVSEITHRSLAEAAMMGNDSAIRERLLREIMCVDQCSWEQAHAVLAKMDEYNEQYYWVESMPYRVGIFLAIIIGILSAILVFWRPIAYWYGVEIACEDPPEDPSIDEMTVNQIGSWTWTWMEPMIGTATFLLLCFQFMRGQTTRMNMNEYSQFIGTQRGLRIRAKFKHYDGSMTAAWADRLPKVKMNFMPHYDRHGGFKGPTSNL